MTTEEGIVADPMSSPNDLITNLDLGSLMKDTKIDTNQIYPNDIDDIGKHLLDELNFYGNNTTKDVEKEIVNNYEDEAANIKGNGEAAEEEDDDESFSLRYEEEDEEEEQQHQEYQQLKEVEKEQEENKDTEEEDEEREPIEEEPEYSETEEEEGVYNEEEENEESQEANDDEQQTVETPEWEEEEEASHEQDEAMECQVDEEIETPDEEMPENPEEEEEEEISPANEESVSPIETEQLNSGFNHQSSEISPITSIINHEEFVQSPGPARFKKLTLAPLHTLQEPRVVEPLKISLPPLSPHSNYSSSSESVGSVNISQKKKKKRHCTVCNLQFRHKIDFLNHHKSHVSLPTILIKRLSVKDFQFQEYIKRQKERVLCARKKTGPPNLYNGRTHYVNIAPAPPNYNHPEGSGLKLKLKMSGDHNFEVVQNIKIENEAELREQQQRDHLNRIRVLTAREIKASPPHSPRPPNIPLNPLEAMYELTSINNSMPNFMKSPGDKIHFECPTLDGLDQFHMENDKDAAAALLKQLLESPQLPQENEWHNSSTSEFISIDRLAHICTICHSNFPDAVMLYEHKRITGHGFENMMHPLPPHQQQQQHHQQQQRRPMNIQPQMNRFGQNMPMEQLAQQVRSMPMHPGQPPRYIQPNPMGPPYLQQQPRRPPPPLYRAQGPNPGQQQQQSQQQQPQHRFNLMQMNYHPNHPNHPSANHPNHQIHDPHFRGLNQNGPGMNGGGIVMNNFQMRPQQPGQQQQQQQMSGMMRPPGPMMRLQRPPPPLRPEMRPGPLQMKRPGNFMQQMRASPNNTPSPPTMKKPSQLMTPPPPKKIRVDDGDDCQLISMQPRSDGLPIIQSVQGAAPPIDRPLQQQKSKESIHLSDQITLSIKSKDAAQNKNPKDVANILANRGITVTPSVKMKEQQLKMQQQGKSGGTNSSAEDAVHKLQLNSSVSIISKKKSIDLTNDDVTPATKKIMDEFKPIQPNLKNTHEGIFIPCSVPECDQKFLSADSLNKHLQRGHKNISLRIHKCKICPAKFSTTDGLAFHQKKVHNIHKTTADELGLPIVDLRNDETRNKLAALGIINYIPLTNLNKTTGGTYGLPIISVQGAANNAICNIMAMGADSVLSIGPVKPIPSKNMLN